MLNDKIEKKNHSYKGIIFQQLQAKKGLSPLGSTRKTHKSVYEIRQPDRKENKENHEAYFVKKKKINAK